MSQFSFEIVAQTGGSIKSFVPYVPSINDSGAVAFQASLSTLGSAVFVAQGSAYEEIVRSGLSGIAEIVSHPDVDAMGRTSFYATLQEGGSAAVLMANGSLATLAKSSTIGPLGPTMNDSGAVAFRADFERGAGIYLFDGEVREVARVGERFSAFQGLPLALGDGSVIYRADTIEGRNGIYRSDGTSVVEAQTLGNFPSANDAGEVVYVETDRGIYVSGRNGTRTVATLADGFESFRGALIDCAGDVVFFATPPGGTLGVYRDGARLFGIGDELFGEVVMDFALNPVSINRRGDIAFRVAFESGEAIVKGSANLSRSGDGIP